MDKGLIIKNGHIIDPSQGIDGVGDVIIEDGKISRLRRHGDAETRGNSAKEKPVHRRVIDATGLYVLPGLIDMHVHLREPGFEHKETIRTGTLAAIRGGFTSICCMPNTNPVNDNATVTSFIIKKAIKEGSCDVFPIGAITKGQKGEELAELGIMCEAGCVAFSDDGMPVMNSLVMRRALEYSKIFGVPVISHCEDLTLAEGGSMNEGVVSSVLGLKGIPSAAEDIMVARDIILAGLTGGRLHIAHVSTRDSVEIIRNAKKRGVAVTAETCPHYFSITEKAVEGYNTNAKVNPPLRTQRDVEAIREGLADGTIDIIVTDHAPHHSDEKLLEFDRAPSGISGLETSLSLGLKLVEDGILGLSQLVEKMALGPSRLLRKETGTLKVGAAADIVIVDLNKEFKVEADKFVSKGRNTPFDGWLLKGCPVFTIVKGKVHDLYV